ncbi:MAG: bifunctional phosphoribosylaminoimidazolecarboxamide formyltransferase/inosine monophosphate cyclohydrolase [Cyanobacteria bacterium HKST-UBA06]|nr:bifunctional phosphoribosylaminoimidazolecarboxamide formyltransferase/inosine monophosphate cyclohydrolase [Cyanobacteria bacterium HKST-UBA06]
MKTILASVSDKTGLADLIKHLQRFDEAVTVYATGSTAQYLNDHGIDSLTVDSLTGFPEILGGRVKTLHPKVFGGLLATDSDEHRQTLADHGIPAIDLAIVNLYPFQSTVAKSGTTMAEAIETIDIGGVALIRAAAKNWQRVAVLCNPHQYNTFMASVEAHRGQLTDELRQRLSLEAFQHTAQYDTAISTWLGGQLTGTAHSQATATTLPDARDVGLIKIQDLRYGENPDQPAAWYRPQQWLQAKKTTVAAGNSFKVAPGNNGGNGGSTSLKGLDDARPFTQLQGKPMSANNIVDAYAAYAVSHTFADLPACAVIKHNNPCGVAVGVTLEEAYQKAYAADPVSAFGGVFGFNQPVTEPIAEALIEQFFEIAIAPGYTEGALARFAKKKNVRVLQLSPDIALQRSPWMLKDLNEFGLVWQANPIDDSVPALTVVTEKTLSEAERQDVLFGWSVVKHLTSNAIAVVKDGQTLGIGVGQTSRIASTQQALAQAGDKAKGAILASDGFFPATDNIEAAAEAGIRIIIQPGGSLKDADVIAKANDCGMVMVTTGQRCFKH